MKEQNHSQDSGEERKDPFDGPYVGNIWGWKLSLIGLVLIVLMVGLMVYRHYALDVAFGEDQKAEPVVKTPQDSSLQKQENE